MGRSGFEEVTPLAEALDTLLDRCQCHDRTEQIQTSDAAGCVLADAVQADRAVPHYDRAAMDGFAIRATDSYGASQRSPERLAVAEPPVEAGEAVSVHTGSAIPEGADAVVMVEDTETRDNELDIFRALGEGENVAPAGEDIEPAQPLFEAGHKLSPADLGILRATGIHEITVRERPTVSVIPTGEELVERDPAVGEIVETNGLTVSSLVDQWGGESTYRDIVTDDENALQDAIAADLDHDLVVTTGGSSVGDRDLLPEVVNSLGTVFVHGVAIKPGYPVALGEAEGTPVLMLPGYPVSCLLNAVLFCRPAIAALGGWSPKDPPTIDATLTEKIPSEVGSRTFARVQVKGQEATPIRTKGAGALSSVVFADGWVEVAENREGIPSGEAVLVKQWDWEYRP